MKYLKLKLFLLSLICCTKILTAKCQDTHGSLAVQPFHEITPVKQISLLKTAQKDSSYVNLLIKISSIYWREKSLNAIYVDSVIFYGRQAVSLSANLRDINGHNESSFLVCKAYMFKGDLNDAKKILLQVKGEEHIRLLLVINKGSTFYFNLPLG